MKISYKIIKEHEKFTLKNYLCKIHGYSRAMLTALKNSGGIKRNGGIIFANEILNEGDIISIEFPKEDASSVIPEGGMPPVIFEDDCLLIVNKPPFMPCHPTLSYKDNTLANKVAGYYKSKGVCLPVRILGRLDRDTSGLLVITKNPYVHARLESFSKTGEFYKKYYAVLCGLLKNKEGEISLPIKRDSESILKRITAIDGKPAVTRYKIIKEQGNFSLAEILLLTGRTHQIRVHFSEIGHPLLGDWLYSERSPLINRLALMAYHITFTHPVTLEKMEFSLPLDGDMANIFENN